MAFATIAAGDKRYTLTATDLLWAARAAACEAGGRADGTAAVLWTWASLFASSSRFDTFAGLVRAHSQPVNDVWRATGQACAQGGSWGARAPSNWFGEEECSPERLARRESCRSLTWEQIHPTVRDVVERFGAGKLPNPLPRAVDFAAKSVRPKAGLAVVKRIGANVFYTTADSRAWPTGFVKMIAPDGSVATDAPSGGLVAVLLAAAGAAFAYRSWRRS